MPTLKAAMLGRNQPEKLNMQQVQIGENGGKWVQIWKMPNPKHQNTCYQTMMMPLVPQNMGFYYGKTTK